MFNIIRNFVTNWIINPVKELFDKVVDTTIAIPERIAREPILATCLVLEGLVVAVYSPAIAAAYCLATYCAMLVNGVCDLDARDSAIMTGVALGAMYAALLLGSAYSSVFLGAAGGFVLNANLR